MHNTNTNVFCELVTYRGGGRSTGIPSRKLKIMILYVVASTAIIIDLIYYSWIRQFLSLNIVQNFLKIFKTIVGTLMRACTLCTHLHVHPPHPLPTSWKKPCMNPWSVLHNFKERVLRQGTSNLNCWMESWRSQFVDLSVIRVLDCCLVPKPWSSISTLLLAFTIIQHMEVERWQKKNREIWSLFITWVDPWGA